MTKYFLLTTAIFFGEWVRAQTISYFEHIAPIIQKNCVFCHQKSGMAPFGLTNYTEVKRKAKTIKEVVVNRHMPPWHADPFFSELAHENTLTTDEISKIVIWIDNGCFKGDTLPLQKALNGNMGMAVTPDYIIKLPPISIIGNNTQQNFRLDVPFNLGKKNNICHVEFVPDKRKGLMRADVYLQIPARKNKSINNNTGQMLMSYISGSLPIQYNYPISYFYNFPKRGILSINKLTYRESPISFVDESSIYLCKCEEIPQRKIQTLTMGSGFTPLNPKLVIPPHQTCTTSTEFLVHDTLSLLSIQPLANKWCKTITVKAITSDNLAIPLLYIPHWDFYWQRIYQFKKPVKVPAQSKIVLEAIYDNTEENPANPFSPPIEVVEGDNENNEWLKLKINYVRYKLGDELLKFE